MNKCQVTNCRKTTSYPGEWICPKHWANISRHLQLKYILTVKRYKRNKTSKKTVKAVWQRMKHYANKYSSHQYQEKP